MLRLNRCRQSIGHILHRAIHRNGFHIDLLTLADFVGNQLGSIPRIYGLQEATSSQNQIPIGIGRFQQIVLNPRLKSIKGNVFVDLR